MRRLGLLLTGLVFVACGGDAASGGFPGGNVQSITVEKLTQKVVDQLGVDGAFDAIIYAFERGYSTGQVNEAIKDTSLREDGRIPDIWPVSDPLGRVILPNSTRISRGAQLVGLYVPARAPSGASPEEPKSLGIEAFRAQTAKEAARIREEGGLPDDGVEGVESGIVWLILELSSMGYSSDQIVEVLFLGAVKDEALIVTGMAYPANAEVQTCSVLRDEDGVIILPEGFPWTTDGEICQKYLPYASWDEYKKTFVTKGEPDKEDPDQITGFYGGTMTLVQCGADCSVRCEIVRPWRLAVNADGSVRGSTPAQARWTTTQCSEPLEGGWSVEGEWTPDGLVRLELGSFVDAYSVVRGEIENGTLTLSLDEDPRPGDAGRVVQFEAVLTKE